MVPAEGAVELQVKRRRAFGDGQHIVRRVKARSGAGVSQVRDVERVAHPKAVDAERVARQVRNVRIRRPGCTGGKIQG